MALRARTLEIRNIECDDVFSQVDYSIRTITTVKKKVGHNLTGSSLGCIKNFLIQKEIYNSANN